MISLKEENVLQFQGRSVQEFRLDGQSVSIDTGKIEDGLHSLCLQECAGRKGSQSHDAVLKIRDIDRIHPSLQKLTIPVHPGKVASFGRLKLDHDNKLS
jgi:hypothetical protein